MDFVLAILPWHIIMGLNMKRKEKLTVAFGLSLGALYVTSRCPSRDNTTYFFPIRTKQTLLK